MKFFAAFVMFLAANAVDAGDRPLACLPSDQFQIEGIGPGEDISKVKGLGPAVATGTYEGEDDGGSYQGVLQQFDSLEINHQQQRGIERVATTSRHAALPGAIRIGMPLAQVGERLHFDTEWLTDKRQIVLPICGLDTGAEVHLHFTASEPVLYMVELIHYDP